MNFTLDSIVPECYLGLFHSLDTSDIMLMLARPASQPTQTVSNLTNHGASAYEGTGGGKDNDLNDSYFAYVVGPFLCAFIILWNLVLIYLLCKVNKRITITNKLFIFHSFTDLMAGFFVVPIQIAMHFRHGYTCWYMSLALMMTSFSQCTGVGTLLTISVIRFLSIAKPLKRVGSKTIILAISMQVLLASSIGLFTFFVYFNKSSAQIVALNFIALFTMLFVSSVGLVICNMTSYILICKQAKRRHLKYGVQRNNKRNNKAVTTLVIITACYIVCTAPYFTYTLFLAVYLYLPGAKLGVYFGYLKNLVPIQIMYLLNCGLTAAIYACQNRVFVDWFRHKTQRNRTIENLERKNNEVSQSNDNSNDTLR